MVNKIINWFGGGIFRTLGRFVAYLILGLIVGFLFSKSNIKIFNLFGFDTIYAADLTPTSFQFDARFTTTTRTFYDKTNKWYNTLDGRGSYVGTVNGGTAIQRPSGKVLTELSLKYYYSSNFISGNSYNFKVRINTSNNGWNLIKNWTIRDVRGGTSTSDLSNDSISTFSIVNLSHDSEDNKVYYVTFSITPIKNIKYIWIYFAYQDKYINNFTSFPEDTYNLNFGNVVARNSGVAYVEGVGSKIEQQTQAINNQTTIIQNESDKINNSINDVNDTLKDDDVNDDSNDMGDFLNDYEFSNDGLLTTLMTMPITFLNNVLTNDSDADFCRTFRGKNICIPSGRILWGRSTTCNENTMLCDSSYGVSDFKTFFSLVVGGYLFYKMILAFISTSEKAINPNEDKVEVMRL